MLGVPYNLIDERWIPVRRTSGRADWIAPWQIAEANNPPLALASPRPDFDGALIQFLIGLLQTAAPPKTKGGWGDWYDRVPEPEKLRKVLAAHRPAFNLDGDGPRFMQDLELRLDEEPTPIEQLLIGSPGEQTLELNADLFLKRGLCPALGFPAAAMALYCMQSNSPAGGTGYRVSLRGGGPLTTVLLGDNLFHTVWLNVLRRDVFEAGRGDATRVQPSATFPWMAKTRTSEKDRLTSPEDIHPAQHYWAMPRRIRLAFNGQVRRCGVFGGEEVPVVTGFWEVNLGANYKGAFNHPLTPYTVMPDGQPPNPRKGQPEGLPYRDWPLMVTGDGPRQPASVVTAYRQDQRFMKQATCRIHAFGYDMKNAKARAWSDATVPLLWSKLGTEEEFGALAAELVAASDEVRGTLLGKLKDALVRRPAGHRWDLGYLSRQFWAATESAFFSALEQGKASLEQGDALVQVREQWLEHLHRAALDVFEGASQEKGDFAATDVKRVSKASSELRRFTSPQSLSLRKAVGLPPVASEGEDMGAKT